MAVYFRFILLFFFSHLAAQQSYTIPCIDFDKSLLSAYLPEQWHLLSLNYVCDVPFSATEFHYLMGIEDNTLVHRAQLEQGLYALHKKGIFEEISLEVTSYPDKWGPHTMGSNPMGINLTVHLKGSWTVGDIKSSSSALIKRYANYYGLNSGECFDEIKHKAGLLNIQQQAFKHGYCAARVESTPQFNEATKSVTIPLTIQLGPLFHITNCRILTDETPLPLITTIERSIQKKLKGTVYRTKEEQLGKDHIAQLLAKEGFFNAEIELEPIIDNPKAAVTLHYHLRQGLRILFEGNQLFCAAQLYEHLSQQNGIGLFPLQLIAQDLKRFYENNGFFNVVIELKQENDVCVFVVHEGVRSKIAQVVIQGNVTFDVAWIMRRFFSSCSAGHYYDQRRINKALERLRIYYEHHGFINAKISSDVTLTDSSDTQLRIIVQEGTQYHIGPVTYRSLNNMHEMFPALEGLPFYAECVTAQKQLILDYLRTQGYLYAQAEPVFSYENQLVSICWHITEGKKFSFGKTIIQGPSWLDISYLLPRLPYQEGEPLCIKTLEEAVDTIRALHVCDTIHICPDQNTTFEQQPILLKITPDDPFEIRARFGIAQVSNNFTFRPGTTYAVGGSFIYTNPLGHADQLRFNMDFTRFEHTTAAEYIFPLKTKLPLSGLIKAYDSFYQQPLFPGSDQSLYTVLQRGFLAGINLNYKSLTAGLNYGVEWATIKNVCQICACALDFQPSLIDTNIPSFIIEPTMLAHYENPWMSSTTLLSIKGVMPLYTRQAATGFVRFLVEQSGAVRLSPVITCAGRIRMGHVFNQFFRAILPPERFYLGGAFSVRGYESDLVPPLSLVKHDNCCVLVPRGGRSMINLNVELRYEVGRYMVFALFQDVGALSDGFTDMHWVAATGGGVRFKTPIGIVRFDVGFKWKALKHESCCAWFLTLGNPF